MMMNTGAIAASAGAVGGRCTICPELTNALYNSVAAFLIVIFLFLFGMSIVLLIDKWRK